MIGVIKKDIRYNVFLDKKNYILSDDLTDFIGLDGLILPFGGIDSYYDIKGSNINLLDILRVNGIDIIFTGFANDKLKELCEKRNIKLVELMSDMDFVKENARLTACGIIEFLHCDDMLVSDLRIILFGYGNINYMLAKLLDAYGVDFGVYTEDRLEKKFVVLEGYKLSSLEDVKNYDFIINTIPVNIDCDYSIFKDKVVIDVASMPYGFDFNKIDYVSKKYEILGSVPSRFFYKSGGKLIYKTVEKYLKK